MTDAAVNSWGRSRSAAKHAAELPEAQLLGVQAITLTLEDFSGAGYFGKPGSAFPDDAQSKSPPGPFRPGGRG
jgi:hypothetical protein